MESPETFVQLKRFMQEHKRSTVPVDNEGDFEEQYIEALEKRDIFPDSFEYASYMRYVYSAPEIVECFLDYCPLPFAIMAFRDALARTYFQYDRRDSDSVIYSSDVVLMVVMLSCLCGNDNCKKHAQFWFEHNPILQYLIPGMPSPKWMISAETIRTFLKMIPDDAFSSMFKQYFGDAKIKAAELLENIKKAMDDTTESSEHNFRHLVGGDGQELRSSFRRGETNRMLKGAHRVSLFDCDARNVLNYTAVKYKNHETQAFMAMLDGTHINHDDIFYADALNAREQLISFLNERGFDWIFAIKTNLSNKVAANAIEQYLKEHPKGHEYFHFEQSHKESKRVEQRFYDIVPASAFPQWQQEGFKEHTGTIIRVYKITDTCLKDDRKKIEAGEMPKRRSTFSTLYFISSLEYNDANCAQIVHSLKQRWLFETQHNTLDTVMLQDNQHCCDDNHLAAIIGLNSMVYNVATFARQKMSQQKYASAKRRSKKTPARPQLLSYNMVFYKFRLHPLIAMQYLCEYFSTLPAE